MVIVHIVNLGLAKNRMNEEMIESVCRIHSVNISAAQQLSMPFRCIIWRRSSNYFIIEGELTGTDCSLGSTR